MRHTSLQRIQRILVGLSFIALAGIGLIAARVAGLGLPDADGVAPQGIDTAAFNRHIAIISGHAGNDSGAVCEDANGRVTLTEADVNAQVAKRVAERLRRAGADVSVLQEYDPQLDGLLVDALLSIHADSCINASGYKAANYMYSESPQADARLLACIDHHYPAVTGLRHHPNTVTHNMTEYHAFRKIGASTPAAILELGFLGGDRALLEKRPNVLAKGIADSLLCFLHGDAPITP